MNNEQCTYCGQLNHKQGPNCPLWCKHREEMGIPIIRYDNQPPLAQVQQNRAPQASVVIVEEVKQWTKSVFENQQKEYLNVLHV